MLNICKEVVVFLFLAKLLEGFQNGGKYGRFVKLVISLIVVLKIVTPIVTFFDGDFSWEHLSDTWDTFFLIEEIGEIKEDLGAEEIFSVKSAEEDDKKTDSQKERVKEVERVNIMEIKVNPEENKWER